ncbi:MAG TPA: hypothetical protein VGO93_20605 [Candidatus Xenobia bacterium]|jgi:hypothetical protein
MQRSPVDLLLQRGGQRRIHPGVLLALCGATLGLSMPVAMASSSPVGTEILSSLGLVLPLLAAWDSRVLETLKRTRTLELVPLAPGDGVHWSDGLTRRSLRSTLEHGLVVACLVWLGDRGGAALVWLPSVLLMTVLVAYAQQLWLVQGSRLVAAVLALAFVGLGLAWAAWNPVGLAVVAGATLALLGPVRSLIGRRLENLDLSPRPMVRTVAGVLRPRSSNPLVVREYQRERRRARGLVSRYGLAVLFLAPLAWVPADMLPAWMALYTLLAMVVTCWIVPRRLFEERRIGAADLVRISALSAQETLDGWLSWSLGSRLWDIGLLAGVATMAQPPGLLAFVCAGATSLLFLRSSACAAVTACHSSAGWLAVRVRTLQWMLPGPLLVLAAASPLALVTLPLSLCVYLASRRTALGVLSG